jgi:aryl-alcohol dehydrogenase-like predicted oxidoreductase
MEKRRVGISGLELSRLGLGTMTWGRDTDEIEAADQCRAYLDAGGNFLDTSPTYGDGDSERLIGGLISTLFKRDEVIIASKAGVNHSENARRVNATRQFLIADLDRTLERLGTDFIDLWQISNWDDLTPIEETLSALDYAYTTGRARYVGVSNYSGWQVALAATKQQSNTMKAPLTSTNNEYSLLNRHAENEILDAVVNCGLGFIAWAPLARGVLTGKYRKGVPSDSRAAAPHFAKQVEPYLDDRSSRIVEAVVVAAQGLGYSPLEIALAWVRDAPGVSTALVGARTGAQLRGILKSEEIELPSIVRSALDDVSF